MQSTGQVLYAPIVLLLEDVKRRDGTPITVTARGLFLTRDLRVQSSDETTYDATRGVHDVPRWDHDTYVGGLAVDADDVDTWVQRGARVLDLASGLSVVPTELAALGVRVDAVDGEFDDHHPAFDAAALEVRQIYVQEMRHLASLWRDTRYAMAPQQERLFSRCLTAAAFVASNYPRGPARRLLGDARDLAGIEDVAYDVVLSGWLMVHLDDASQARALASMIRVAAPGGELRIKAGHGGDARRDVARAFDVDASGRFVVGGRRGRIDPRSARDLLVLRIDEGG